MYCSDGQNYYLVNKTNNFTIVYQGRANNITNLMIHYPYYILINDNNTALYQIDIQINQTIHVLYQSIPNDLFTTL